MSFHYTNTGTGGYFIGGLPNRPSLQPPSSVFHLYWFLLSRYYVIGHSFLESCNPARGAIQVKGHLSGVDYKVGRAPSHFITCTP
jgi:hypothetical protein